jgi:hypothetical protein
MDARPPRALLRRLDYANQQCYAGRLSTPLIQIALPRLADNRAGHAWADVGPTDQHGARLEVRIHPELLRWTFPNHHRPADPNVLHEQAHAWQVEILGWDWDPANDWHGPAFRLRLAEVDREVGLYLPLLRST